MTQASLPKGSSQDDQSSKPINVACGPSDSLRPTSENPSDNETSERPVREKLKKTSIASISQHAKKAQHGVLTTEESDVANFASAQKEALPEVGSGEAADDSIRGRPVKKRSFDDLEAAENDGDSAAVNGGQIERTNGHARKRSRDVRTNETVKADRQLRTFDPTVEEEGEDSSSRTELPDTQATALEEAEPNIDASSEITHQMEVEHDLNTGEHGGKAEEVFLETGTDHSDREMPDPAASPRKKRSRDQFDTEVDREQKIPATEEAKAQRRSVELERTETTKGRDENAAAPEVSLPSENVSTSRMANSTTGTEHGLETGKQAHPSSFGITSSLAPTADKARSVSPSKRTDETQSQTSAASFASSGFAALSSSSASPFGALGSSSMAPAASSPFLRSTPISPNNTDSSEALDSTKAEPSANGGFGGFAKTSPRGFGATQPSPFAASGAANSSGFGGSVFGGGFGGAFGGGGGGKLTNFAAPIGDTKLGTTNGAIKPIGSPTREGDDDDDENSDEEAEALGENKNEGSDEVDDRFQHKDVETGEDDETTIFSSRASLYTFKDKAWKEGGKGTFKLNINASSMDDVDLQAKSGRFIMRAHQTFRVLLNAPILKKMTVGDGKGKEPSGKSFSFGVVENGTLVPYLLKLSDTAESRTLFQGVRKLQNSMVDGGQSTTIGT